jgi:hypothetical protein
LPPTRAAAPEEPLKPEPATQPLKSLALEFTPDGAGDVRLRVSERAGEVHISLHSTDSSITGKLHEGVHDLVGSLSKAGYDAEAWTPKHSWNSADANSGGQRQQQEERRQQQPKSSNPDDEDFGGIYEQIPIQEVS